MSETKVNTTIDIPKQDMVMAFAQPIQRSYLNRNFTDDEMNFFKSYTDWRSYEEQTRTEYSRDTHILDRPELSQIKKFVLDKIDMYVEEFKIEDVEFYVTQSWLNRTAEHGFHHRHKHPNSIISGVLYITDGTPFSLIRPGPSLNDDGHTLFKTTEDNYHNSSEYQIKIEPTMMLMFPSYIEHFVRPNKSKEFRMSLAFNAYYKGTVGTPKSCNSLTIK